MTTPTVNSKTLTAGWRLTDTPDLTKDAQAGDYSEAYLNPTPAELTTNARVTLGLRWTLS